MYSMRLSSRDCWAFLEDSLSLHEALAALQQIDESYRRAQRFIRRVELARVSETMMRIAHKLRNGAQAAVLLRCNEFYEWVSRYSIRRSVDPSEAICFAIRKVRRNGIASHIQPSYLRRMAYTAACSLRSRSYVRQKREEQLMDVLIHRARQQQSDVVAGRLEEEAAYVALTNKLHEALEQLPEDLKTIVTKLFYDNMSVRAIAKQFNWSSHTVADRLVYSMLLLRPILEDSNRE